MASQNKIDLEKSLNAVENSRNLSDVHNQTSKLVTEGIIEKSSLDGKKIDQKIDGFISKTDNPNIKEDVDGSEPINQYNVLSVVNLTEDISEGKSNLIKTVSNKSTLQTITSSDTFCESGLLDDCVSSAHPAAITEVMTDVVKTNNTQTKKVVQNHVDITAPIDQDGGTSKTGQIDDYEQFASDSRTEAFNSVIGKALGNSNNISSLLTSVVDSYINNTQTSLNQVDKGFNSIIENINETTFASVVGIINSTAIINGVIQRVPEHDIIKITNFVASKQHKAGAIILKKYSDSDLDVIETKLRSIDNRAVTKLEDTNAASVVTSKVLDDYNNTWNGNLTKESTFNNFIEVKEELVNEISQINREVTEIVIHSTNTPLNVNVTVSDLHRIDVDNGGGGINYHYLIRKDGTLERGRPVDIQSDENYNLVNDHHKNSIHLMLVGGVDTEYRKNLDETKFYSAKSYSIEQYKTLDMFLSTTYESFPGIQVFGISDINKEISGPHLIVTDYIKLRFNKQNIEGYDPSEKEPLTITDLRLNRS